MTLFSRQMLAFQAVADELHFGRAARRLHMTQPPLSQQVRLFEARVGVPLIERTTRAVRLTPAGRVMFEAIQRMIQDGQQAIQVAHRVSRGESGLLRVGFTPTAAYRLVPAALKAYRAAYPDVRLTLTEADTGQLRTMLAQDRIDLALVRHSTGEPDEHLHLEPVDSEPLVVALPAGHSLARHRSVAVQALSNVPLIGFARDTSVYFHRLLAELFAQHKVIPQYVMESVLPTLLALVEAGIGAAVVPASVRELRPSGVVYRPLKTGQSVASILYLAHRKNDANGALPALCDAIQVAGGGAGC